MTETQNNLVIIILAAGKGTRMKSPLPKVLHPIAGLPMISWLIQSCEALKPQKMIIVRSPDLSDLDALVAPHEIAVQEHQNGTGDAVKAALPALDGFEGRVLIVMGDEPFVPVGALQDMAAGQGLMVMGFETHDPHGLGRLVMSDGGKLKEIIEEKDCSEAQKQITLCNAGNYALDAAQLKQWIPQIESHNAQGEFYLTDLAKIATHENKSATITAILWEGPWGINTQLQLAAHEKLLQNALRAELMAEGVQMIDPESVTIHYDTKIAGGTLIEPNVFFGSGVNIDSGVTIKAFSYIERAHIKSGASIGPYARIRPGSEIGENAKIGNFAEINRSTIGKGSKIPHHAYVGDTQMGKNTNFAAGAITANYDGKNKHKTVIGDDVMIGTNVNLIAPVNINDGAFIAAGSTISSDVPAGKLAVARTTKAKILPKK